MGCLYGIPILSRGLVVPLDSIIERMMSDTYDEDDMPFVNVIFDEIEYFMAKNPMLVYEELLEDSKFNAIADVYYATYGDAIEC